MVVLEGQAEMLPHRRFLEELLNMCAGKTALNYKLLPSYRDFIGASVGVGGLSFRFVAGKDKCRVELFIATPDAEKNKDYFEGLRSHKRAVEDAFGEGLSWERLDDSKSCRVAHHVGGGVNTGENNWEELQTELVDAMARFENALLPFVSKLV